MNTNLRQFQAFVTVARLGSFTRAAKHLHLSQPALTVQIRQLEGAMGARLFDRSTRMVKPTAVGRNLAPMLERVLHEIDAVMVNTRDLASHIKGTVTIGALPSISSKLIPSTIAKFQKQYPGIVVRLRDVMAQRLVWLVKGDEIDFGIGTMRTPDPRHPVHTAFHRPPRRHLPGGASGGTPAGHHAYPPGRFPLILMDPETQRARLVDRAFESIGEVGVPRVRDAYPSTAVAAGPGRIGPHHSALIVHRTGKLKGSQVPNHPASRAHPADRRDTEFARRSLSPSAETFIKVVKAICKPKNTG